MVSEIYFSFYTYLNISIGLKIIHYKPYWKLLPPLASIQWYSLCFLPLFGCIPCLLSLILFPDHWKHISLFILQPILDYSSLALFSLAIEFSNHVSQLAQSLTRVQLFATPWTAACQASLPITNSQSLLKLMSIELVMPYNHLILCRPLPFHPQSFPASGSFQMTQFFASGG